MLGASLEADTVRCGELHTCNFAFTQKRPDIVPRELTGPTEALAAFTTDWLGEILRRPTLRYDRLPVTDVADDRDASACVADTAHLLSSPTPARE